MNKRNYIFLLAGVIALSATQTIVAQSTTSYTQQIEEWKKKRIENLKAEKGWLNLAGLFWVEEGVQTFGSAAGNQFVFPKGSIPPNAGKLYRKNNSIYLIPSKQVVFTVNDNPVSDTTIIFSDKNPSPVVAYKNLRFTIIKRADKLGVRLRNLASATVTNFKGIERFETDSNWRVAASLLKDNTLKNIAITNVLGQTNETAYAGKIAFTINNTRYTLDAIDEGEDVLLVFGDKTSGKSTYHGGRFISIPKSQLTDSFYIDFNKAYNPPCVFTPFATCPLPPPQNILPIAINAGEKNYGKH